MKPLRTQLLLPVWFLWFAASHLNVTVAAEYTIKGLVQSVLFDINGNPRLGEIEPGWPASNACPFVWYRKGEQWRLDIKEPMHPMTNGVWKTVMPFSATELITIISIPPSPSDPNSKGNAVVTVMTNQFLANQNIYGAHVVWLNYNLDQILAMIGPSNKCPPFWVGDPAINCLLVDSHEIIRTNGSILFWNPGHYFARDGNQNLIFEGRQPKYRAYPSPADKGFAEAQFHPAGDLLDETQRIPRQAELSYWVPFKDEADPKKLRLIMTSKITVVSQSVDPRPVPESVFKPAWTNATAVVFDFRETAGGVVLNYITKSNQINPSRFDLLDRKLVSTVYGNSYPIQISTTAMVKRYRLPVLLGATVGCLILVLWWFRSKGDF